MQLQPSALAQPLQKEYSMVDIIKYQRDVKRQETELAKARAEKSLDKLYDLGIAVASNDYGVYGGEMAEAWSGAISKASQQVKEGKPLADTMPIVSDVVSKSARIKAINENTRTYAQYIAGNNLLTPEEKQRVIKDHENSVFFNEDGSVRSIEEAYSSAKDYPTDVSAYYSPETMWNNFKTGKEQTKEIIPVAGGTELRSLYPWQQIDENGSITMKTDKDGLISEDVYTSFISNNDRNKYIEYQAKKALESKYPDGIPEDKLDAEKRNVVTQLIKTGAEDGGIKSFQYKSTSMYPSSYYEAKTPVDYTKVFEGLGTITPDPGSPKKDVTSLIQGLNDNVSGAYVSPDGKIHVSTKRDSRGRPIGHVTYNNTDEVVAAIGEDQAKKQWGGYSGKPAKTETKTVAPEPEGEKYTDENGQIKNIVVKDKTGIPGYVDVTIDGKTKSMMKKDFDKLYKKAP